MLTILVTPDTSTRARCMLTLEIPELPRNPKTHGCRVLPPVSHCVDLHSHLDLRLDLEEEHLGRLHPEIPDVEVGFTRQTDGPVLHRGDVIRSSYRRDTPRNVTSPVTR